ncbi:MULTISPECIES: hypothetical protein [Altererythrobacter]|jgi:hypothetical protein|uniref:Uncharacterized protein n=2 Tax=Altererythrobacter TaxID=361177 RepID=A0A562USZ6_9SPHN|nr:MULTISPECIES: hypothetical protein [Altererythrobacter]MBO6609439.1 hypothetical protein [Altererythrobacter sp.]MBO6642306.1 hypothetical protein [Altererythrobacter sp.]MBO6709186.1 hypothetical protein [Altererythrobacter sp.]MBO6944706.1 hypothetical protein [Altererythrobacter sp.]MDX1703745.1 hypothetical protein [Altererythrobacter ishigakiensis]
MIPGLDDLMSPDMQKILSFLLPALAAISILVMNLTRGFSIPGKFLMIVFAAIAIYFFPTMMEVF